ncbi:hypothetical protein FOA52_012401 [Chlamydomonas sp. UWO 241]|nr:hypothetical protein FOA52_012401 [Chlamydomonas sp. UWO 241]
MFSRDRGEKMRESMSVPRLKVRKNWFKGLNPDPNDHSHPDVSDSDEIPGAGAQPPPPPPAPAQGKKKRTPLESLTEIAGVAVAKYRGRLVVYRETYGKEAAEQLLRETKERNEPFYNAVVADIAAHPDDVAVDGAVGNAAAGGDAKVDASLAAGLAAEQKPVQESAGGAGGAGGGGDQAQGGDHQVEAKKQDDTAATLAALAEKIAAQQKQRTGRRLTAMDGDSDADGGADGAGDGASGVEADPEGVLSDEAVESFEVFDEHAYEEAGGDGTHNNEYDYNHHHYDSGRYGEMDDILNDIPDADSFASQDYSEKYDELGDRFPGANADYVYGEGRPPGGQGGPGDAGRFEGPADYASGATGGAGGGGSGSAKDPRFRWARDHWEDEQFVQSSHTRDEEFVFIDAHILTTPALADIDDDGHEELVVAVSYFFDKEYYDDPERSKELGGLDIGKYVASGVVVFDLRTRQVKWEQHLDLSTDATTFKAYAYASPTIIDLDSDATMDVVIGTSMGFLYVLDCMGEPRAGWPIQMGEIQGQALVADIDNDGEPEIVAADTRGNVAAFRKNGAEVWARHVHSLISQGPNAGDIDGDGDLELVFGTSSGHVYALRGADGLDVPHFPFRTHGRIHAPILITRLADGPSQHLIVPSFDGFLYLIDGGSGCADAVDIGETSYSMVLADDLNGNGRLDLVLATMNGNIYCLETPAEYHPLKAWPSQVVGANLMVARHDYFGVYATASSRVARDAAGKKLQLQLSLIDKRGTMMPNGTLSSSGRGPYNVTVVLKGVGVREMASGPQPVIGMADTVQHPGKFVVELPCPLTRTTATVHIELVDRHGITLVDEFSLSFHLHFHKLLKWLVALPPLIAAVAVVIVLADEKRRHSSGGAGGGDAADLPEYYPHVS